MTEIDALARHHAAAATAQRPPGATPAAQPPRTDGVGDTEATARTATIRSVATRFEAVFLAEMLQHTGLARPPEQFGGGAGERQFAPMLVRAYADALAERGGIGLADRVAATLARRDA